MFKSYCFYIICYIIVLNHNVWLPKLKFTLQTISVTFPKNPNDVEKKKYYDFIQNLPLFFPFKPFGKNFIELLEKYPVTPYLSSRMSFMKWVFHLIHQKQKKLIRISLNVFITILWKSLWRLQK